MTLTEEILRLKKEKNAVILAHNYQPEEIQRLADYTGDSLELAIRAKDAKEDIIVFCGVLFMAETAKILNPGKKVILPVKEAGCPLADYLTPEMVIDARKKYPGAQVVLYVNSSAESKAEADITCTSANAVSVVASLESDTILFGPDSNLASWVQEQIPDKKIIPLPKGGHCPVHQAFTEEMAEKFRGEGYMTVCHPECPKAVRDRCDLVASTGGMVKNAFKSDKWIVLTEKDMVYRLKTEFPLKEFKGFETAVCEDMKLITPKILKKALLDEKPEITLPEDIMKRAGKAIEKMIALSR
ncbi:quinolinate synthase NadA [Methanoplanus sp. FWC-SCC4]|uniref:Quinolinate synthase n=1 Tax=Methanochimaera problematica TaxID=2609417 RepID=A0AA97I3Y6_9EURY|nr:quinolinate synthase NadA [Methanoplanus sp. FWC-SCC4]WOF17173.1 quinolinate synthase NadA [Methanoplanus sp. FWC-SCC4]